MIPDITADGTLNVTDNQYTVFYTDVSFSSGKIAVYRCTLSGPGAVSGFVPIPYKRMRRSWTSGTPLNYNYPPIFSLSSYSSFSMLNELLLNGCVE